MHKGRSIGAVSELTKVTREVFSEAFIKLGGVPALVAWAEETGNTKHFYTLFAKVLPRELKVENINRTHEQFIELIQMENQHMLDTKGEPLELVESVPEKKENEPKVT